MKALPQTHAWKIWDHAQLCVIFKRGRKRKKFFKRYSSPFDTISAHTIPLLQTAIPSFSRISQRLNVCYCMLLKSSSMCHSRFVEQCSLAHKRPEQSRAQSAKLPKRRGLLWARLASYSVGTGHSFAAGKAEWAWSYLSLSVARFQNGWGCTSTSPHAFIVRTEINLFTQLFARSVRLRQVSKLPVQTGIALAEKRKSSPRSCCEGVDFNKSLSTF